MIVVVNLHCQGVDVGLERVEGIAERRQRERRFLFRLCSINAGNAPLG
jgi:hypothetical protein